MKKIIIMFMLAVSLATVATSCKKDKQSEKERVTALLISGKWYTQSLTFSNGTIRNCFNSTDFWEFKADGTFSDTVVSNGYTYTVSDDGKTITIFGDVELPLAVTSISQSTLEVTLSEGTSIVEYIFGKTAKNCIP